MFILLFSGIMLLYYQYVGYDVNEITYEQVEARLTARRLSNLRGQLPVLKPLLARPRRLPPLLRWSMNPKGRECHPVQLIHRL